MGGGTLGVWGEVFWWGGRYVGGGLGTWGVVFRGRGR